MSDETITVDDEFISAGNEIINRLWDNLPESGDDIDCDIKPCIVRVDRAPVNLVDPPETIRVAIVVEIPSRAQPGVPLAYEPFHGFQRQREPHRAQVIANMLRHPIFPLVNLAHAHAPFYSGGEGVESIANRHKPEA